MRKKRFLTPKRTARLFAVGILFASCALGPGAGIAKTHTIRAEAETAIPTPTDKGIADMLSEVLSVRKANLKAVDYLKDEGLLRETQISEVYFPALASLLARNTLGYHSRLKPSSAVYKYKMSYDSAYFPEDLDAYFAKNFYQIVLLKRNFEFDQQLRVDASQYLSQVQAATPTERLLIYETRGKNLFNLLQVNRWLTESSDYMQADKSDKALALIDKAITLSPEIPDLYLIKALILGNVNDGNSDFDLAIKNIKKAIALEPDEAIFHALLGNTYFNQGILMKESQKSYTKAIELEPNFGLAYLMRAYVMRAQMYCLKPLEDFKKACELGIEKACKETSC